MCVAKRPTPSRVYVISLLKKADLPPDSSKIQHMKQMLMRGILPEQAIQYVKENLRQ